MGGFESIDPRYREIHDRAVSVLEQDRRVRSVDVAGSVGTGTADEWSDLDLHVVAEDGAYDDLLATWPEWLGAITPTVFARTPIAPFIINSVTADGLTLDVAVYPEAPATLTAPPPAAYRVGMLSSRAFDDLGSALDYAVAEQLRGLAGPFISLIRREEHLRHLTGVPHILGLLTTVFLAETESPPAGKHWNRSFTPEQLAAAASLPPVSATRDGVMGFGLALAEMTVTRARPLFPRYGLTWPVDLASVAARRMEQHLGIDTSSWLF